MIPFRDKLGQNREVSHRIPVAWLSLVVDDVSGRVLRKIFFKRCPRARQNPVPSVDTRRQPAEKELIDLRFAWRAVGSVKSNAIVLARDGATIGIGAGQMSRVDAAFLSVHKARLAGHDTKGSVMGSDAFFPFRDGVEQAAEAGVSAIVQPGGSVRDEEVIQAANEFDITMIFTGMRQFRH